jgi:cell division protein FtsW
MKHRTGYMDLFLFFAVLALLLFSVALVYSASITNYSGDHLLILRRQVILVVVAITAFLAGSLVNYHSYQNISKLLILGGVFLLMLMFFIGTRKFGSTRWIILPGGLSLQPSEIAKFTLIIHLSALLAQKQRYIHEFRNGFLPLLLWSGLVASFIYLEPNLSTATIIMVISFMMMFVGRTRLKHMIGVFAVALPLILLFAFSQKHFMERIEGFLTPSDVTTQGRAEQARLQQEMSITALANGGVIGVGPGKSIQREKYLTQANNDFILAIIGEEYGFVGVVGIVLIYLLILFRGMKVSKRATDDFGRFLAFGITITITLFALIHAVVVSGLGPVTGLPLPFLSAGGTSIVFTGYAAGILLNISMYTRIRPRSVVDPSYSERPSFGEAT